MPTITKVTPQQRHPDRVSVFIDGVFAFGLPADTAYLEGVVKGAELDAARIEHLRSLDDAAKATTSAIRLLTERPRSTAEIRSRLRRKGYSDDAIDTAIDRLEGWRYVDDEEFARFWVENRVTHRPRGKRLIEQELRQKGVDRDTIRSAIDDAEIDERAAALELARNKYRTMSSLDPETARRRLAGLLARRGFGWDVVKPALDEVLGERADED